ncbi:aldolase-type TIM barrel family protein [Striga asiatica]|uniref:Aldolase-type TIM barrel family protein n=1 Tax=Striga asiatica TaxID=4170 RepID=A0A5A7QM68_STRAF|nr:aldolase-type TIM barrel family protein [Striga asiatica]
MKQFPNLFSRLFFLDLRSTLCVATKTFSSSFSLALMKLSHIKADTSTIAEPPLLPAARRRAAICGARGEVALDGVRVPSGFVEAEAGDPSEAELGTGVVAVDGGEVAASPGERGLGEALRGSVEFVVIRDRSVFVGRVEEDERDVVRVAELVEVGEFEGLEVWRGWGGGLHHLLRDDFYNNRHMLTIIENELHYYNDTRINKILRNKEDFGYIEEFDTDSTAQLLKIMHPGPWFQDLGISHHDLRHIGQECGAAISSKPKSLHRTRAITKKNGWMPVPKNVQLEKKKSNRKRRSRNGADLGIGDVGILADLGRDDGAELGRRGDVIEGVDFHDGGDGSAGGLEELEHPLPRLRQTGRVRRDAHVFHR